jgi:hypothetical protein
MRVNGDRVVVNAFQFVRQCDILIIWVVSEHDTLGRDVELSHTDTFTSSILKRSDNEKRRRKRPRDAIVSGILSSHPDTPRSSRSLLYEALSSAEHHIESGSSGCGFKERGVVSSIWVFELVSGD